MQRSNEQIRKRNEIGSIPVYATDTEHPADNLAIALCTYFEMHGKCPELEPDENGWNPWAVERTNAVLDAVVDKVLKQGVLAEAGPMLLIQGKDRLMGKQTAEVMYWMSEFLAETGNWSNWCQYSDGRGIKPSQIASAINQATDAAGYTADLQAEDCE